jgi:hypothetical protein
LLSPSVLHFVSRASGQALVSLTIGKPDRQTFNEFVNVLKARVAAESGTASWQKAGGQATAGTGNLQESPADFADDDGPMTIRIKQEVNRDELEQAIGMLKLHLNETLNDARVESFIAALEDLKSDPRNETRLLEVARLFAALGIGQGAVLTYAPYLGFLLSDHPFAD